MRGPINKLTDTQIESKLKAARKAALTGNGKTILLGDGGGLTLQVSKTGTASWLHRYMRYGKPIAVGLGAYPTVSLKLARSKAEQVRETLAAGRDPLSEKRAAEAAARQEQSQAKTFDECATEYIADHREEWKNAKHVQQWENTLATYASPILGNKNISEVTTSDVKRVLSPIWKTKNETASRVRGRIEAILDWATAQDMRSGDNPARWKGHLEHLLAKSTPDQRAQKHHPALEHAELPKFIRLLGAQEGMSRWALEFLILTACRTSEVLNAEWGEIDLEKSLWTIPKERMKAGKEHRVPLLARSLAILEHIKAFAPGRYVFPSGTKDKPMSDMSMTMLLRRMEC